MEKVIEIIKGSNQKMMMDLIVAILIIAIFDILSPLFTYVILKIFNFKKNTKELKHMALYTPIKSFFIVTGIYLALLYLRPGLGFTQEFMEIVHKVYKIIIIITTATGLANSLTRKSRIVRKIQEKSDKEIDDATTRFMLRGARILIYIIAIFIIMLELEYDLSGLITGLGLGSIVLTLAAQDVIKSLLGGFFIFTDKPFKIGEYIKFSTYEGTVEDITFRSTKLRTLDNTIVQIPNSLISSSSVENYSKIEKRRYIANIELVLDTTPEKILSLEKEIAKKLGQYEEIIEDSIDIHFTDINSNGYNLRVVCYLNVLDYSLFLHAKEKINTIVINTLEENGIDMAYDTKTLLVKKD